jgi:hypothetical protein
MWFDEFYEELADRRGRLDRLDAETSRRSGECEFASETDPSVLKVLLRVKPGLGGGYDWVERGSCAAGGRFRTDAERVR